MPDAESNVGSSGLFAPQSPPFVPWPFGVVLSGQRMSRRLPRLAVVGVNGLLRPRRTMGGDTHLLRLCSSRVGRLHPLEPMASTRSSRSRGSRGIISARIPRTFVGTGITMGVRAGNTRGANPNTTGATGREHVRATKFISLAINQTKRFSGPAREGVGRAAPTVWSTASRLGGDGMHAAVNTLGLPDTATGSALLSGLRSRLPCGELASTFGEIALIIIRICIGVTARSLLSDLLVNVALSIT